MKISDQDIVQKAWNFASKAHNGQFVPGTGIPYINHVGSVAMEAMAAVIRNPSIEDPVLLILCGILHDTLEDTDKTYDDLEREFGKNVAEGVTALTKNKAFPSKEERMKDSLERIVKQPREIWMVKLCDRIVNLQPPPAHWDPAKIQAYKDEAVLILSALGPADPSQNAFSIKSRTIPRFPDVSPISKRLGLAVEQVGPASAVGTSEKRDGDGKSTRPGEKAGPEMFQSLAFPADENRGDGGVGPEIVQVPAWPG